MNLQNFRTGVVALFLLAFVPVLLMTGCESSSSSNDDTGTLQIASLTASPASIDVGQNCVIVATVTDGTDPLADRVVDFSTALSLGTLSNSVDTTESNGEASTMFSATQPGTAVIIASIGQSISRTVSVVINAVDTGSGDTTGTGNVHVVAYPTILVGDGTDSTTVTVTVFDANSQVAPDGTVIQLTAGEKFDDIDGNGYFTAGVDTIIYDVNNNGLWDPIGSLPSSAAVAGGNGQAQVTYVSGTMATTVYIRATVLATGYEGFGETTVQLNATAQIGSIFLAASDIHLAVKQTGGLETAILYATGYDGYGNPVPAGIPISFIITDGPDTSSAGEHLGNLSGAQKRGPYSSMTNSMGTAECPISSGTVSGTIRIRAYADTILSNATQIMVHSGPPARIVLGAEECNVDYWGWVNREVPISALVSDIWNNPCPDSTVVYFTCDEGVIKAHEARVQGETGQATTIWYSYGPDAAADGDVMIVAETNGGTLADTSYFTNSWVPDTIWYTNFPYDMDADNDTRGLITVEVRDLNFNYVIGDYLAEVKFNSELLEFEERENGDGCFGSGVGIYVLSTVLKKDWSTPGGDDDGIGAIEYITTRWGGYATVATEACTLRTDLAYRPDCKLELDNTSADYNETVYFTVTIQDRAGNPLGDHTLVATVDEGTLVGGGTRETDAYGMAEFAVTTPLISSGADGVNITVQDIDPRGQITLTNDLTIPVNPTLAVSPASLNFGSALNSLNFTVKNSGYGGEINWTASPTEGWVTVLPVSGQITNNTQQVTVTVDRTGLLAGDYTAVIDLNSDNGTATVTVNMTVP